MLLLQTNNRNIKLGGLSGVTFKNIHPVQVFSNAISSTVMLQLTRLQLI